MTKSNVFHGMGRAGEISCDGWQRLASEIAPDDLGLLLAVVLAPPVDFWSAVLSGRTDVETQKRTVDGSRSDPERPGNLHSILAGLPAAEDLGVTRCVGHASIVADTFVLSGCYRGQGDIYIARQNREVISGGNVTCNFQVI